MSISAVSEDVLTLNETDYLTPLVSRVMSIEDVTAGGPKQNFIARYHGKLYSESSKAYDELAAILRPRQITPLFRIEDGRQTILLLRGVINPTASNPLVNLVLGLLTLFSMLLTGTLFSYQGPDDIGLIALTLNLLPQLWSGMPFAVSMLGILTAHEFGHYLAGRYHRTNVTLPYFMPLPYSPFGTLGAFIQLKEPPKNKRILLDIGIAGPIAGLIVAIPVLLYGLSLSELHTLNLGQPITMEGNSLLYLFSKWLTFGKLLPEPVSYGNLPPLLYWVRYLFTGEPLQAGSLDVNLHPVAWAGWAGLLVTSLNLIPAGQLDGGHLIFVLLGRRARVLIPIILVGLLLLGLIWPGWLLWAFLILLLGRVHAEPLDQITQLDGRRKVLAFLGLVMFILLFTPVPLVMIGG